jgi:hypothetical protein
MYKSNYKQIQNALNYGTYQTLDFLKETGRVLDFIDTFGHYKQKLLLATVLVMLSPAKKDDVRDSSLTEAYVVFRKHLWNLNKNYYNEKSYQKKKEKEESNWLSWSTIVKMQKKYQKIIRNKKWKVEDSANFTKADKEIINNYIILSLYVFHPPRRLEYGNMLIITEKKYDKLPPEIRQHTNYLVTTHSRNSKYFSFGSAKIKSKTKDPQIIVCTREMNRALNMYISLSRHNHDSLLQTTRGNPQTRTGLGRNLNKIFESTGKNISSTMLRHIYISHILKDNVTLKTREHLARLMNHSVVVQDSIYAKY